MSLDSKKIFRTIGATGFITLIPVILHALGIDQFQDVLSERFGAITDLGVLSIISFFLIGSFFITQKGENHSASVISFLIVSCLSLHSPDLVYLIHLPTLLTRSSF